jgi:C4-dicarboxylate transporter DctM subunit
MGYIWITLIRDPSLAPKSSEAMPLKDALMKVLEIWPIIILIIVVLGTMYAGIATPTEAAAMGCLAGLIIAGAERQITWKLLRESAMGAVRTTSMVVLVYTGAHLMGVFMTNQAVFQKLMEWTLSLSVSPYVIYALIMIMYLILGCFMSGLAAIVITLPLVYPIMMAFHFDPIWFGVVIVLQNEMGLLTPPVGSCLFVLHGLNPKEPFSEVAQGSIPFVSVIIVMLILLTIFPGLATWLPTLVFGPL